MKRPIEYVDDSSSDSEYSSSESDTEPETPKNLKYYPIFLVNQPPTKQEVHQKKKHKSNDLLETIRGMDKTNNEQLPERIAKSNFPLDVKKKLIDEYDEKSNSTSETSKFSTYVEKILKIPVGKYKKINPGVENTTKFIENLREKLDDAIAGHNETKTEIIDYITGMIRNPKANSNILALHGPAGVGKTKFVRALGKALDLPFNQISFGGMTDPALLNGHDFTYVGSKPGKIYDAICKAGYMNGIVMLDECFPYYQRIVTSDGSMEIGSLYKKFKSGVELPMIKSFNEKTKEFEYKRITNAWEKHKENLIELNIGGFTTRCTDNHLFLTENGYIKAKDLAPCDNILSQPSRYSSKKLNEDQYQILLGSFLGDGHVYYLKSGKIGLKVRHSYKQHEYCSWKADMFRVKTKIVEKNGFAQTKTIEFDTKIIHINKEFPKIKSTCPQWLIDDLSWAGIAIWLMDDGYVRNDCGYDTCIFSTDRFDLDSITRLVKKLNSMGVDCKHKQYKEKYLRIELTSKGYKTLLVNVFPYIHSSLSYKIKPIYKMIILEKNIYWSFSEITDPILNCIYDIHSPMVGKTLKYKYAYCKFCKKNTYKVKGKTNDWFKCSHAKRKVDVLIELKKNITPHVWDMSSFNYELINITSKKIVKNTGKKYKIHDNKVYDIEIEDNHNFLITTETTKYSKHNIGIVVHNCDKIGDLESSKTKEINGILTHLLDKEQNCEFYDNYIGSHIPLDLSKILFIASFNHEHCIDPIVLNRMKVITIKESSIKEKIEIVKKFTIPEIIKNLNLSPFDIKMNDNVIKHIIINKTVSEPGLRNINKNVSSIFSRINTLLYLEKASESERKNITKDLVYENVKLTRDAENCVIVTLELVDKFLEKKQPSYALSMMYI